MSDRDIRIHIRPSDNRKNQYYWYVVAYDHTTLKGYARSTRRARRKAERAAEKILRRREWLEQQEQNYTYKRKVRMPIL